MAFRRLSRSFSVAIAVLAWLCLGVLLPLAMSFYSADIAMDIVEAAPGDSYAVTEPVILNDTPLVRVERGTLAIVDANGRPVVNAATGTDAASPGRHIRLFNATITLSGGSSRQPGREAREQIFAPVVEALVAGRYETLSLRRTTLVINVLGDGPEIISDVKAEVSARRRGLVSIKGSGLLRGQNVTFDSTVNPARLESSRNGPVRMPLKLALKGSFVDLAFDGRMTLAPDELGLQGQAEMTLPSGRQVARLLGAYWPSGAGLRDLSIRGQMTMTRQTLTFENAAVRMDGNEATGVLAMRMSQPRPVLTGTLAYKAFDANPYLANFAREPLDMLSWRSLAAGVLTVPLGMHLDADLRISADKVQIGKVELGRSAATVALKDGRLLADLAELKFNGGRGGGQVTADFTGYLPKVTVRGKLDQVDMGRLSGNLMASGTAVGQPLLQGQASIVADLSGTGATLQDVLKNFTGKVAVASQTGGRLGVDLRSLAAAAKDRETTGWGAAVRGVTAFDQLDLRLVLRDGTILTENAEARTAEGTWSATGVVNLLSDRIDLRLTQGPIAGGGARQGALEIHGPLSEPKIKANRDP